MDFYIGLLNSPGILALRFCNIYMLFAGWEVRIVKNCDRGLENAARGLRYFLSVKKNSVSNDII